MGRFPEFDKNEWEIKYIIKDDEIYEIFIDEIKFNIKRFSTAYGPKFNYTLKLDCDNCKEELTENFHVADIITLDQCLNQKKLCSKCREALDDSNI